MYKQVIALLLISAFSVCSANGESDVAPPSQKSTTGVIQNNLHINADEVSKFDELYDQAIFAAGMKKKYSGAFFDPTDALMNLRQNSGAQLHSVSLYYLQTAKSSEELEKAVWFFITAFKKETIAHPDHKRPDYPENVLIGRIAAVSAVRYADPKTESYDFGRSYHLNYYAGFLGIQQGYMSAAYIHRYMAENDIEKLLSSTPEADRYGLPLMQATLFRNASRCTPENMRRQFSPWSQELCDAAEKEMVDAEIRSRKELHARYESLNSSGGSAYIMAIIGLAGLAAFVGGPSAPPPAAKSYAPDSCAGLNGLGFMDDTMGNAAALFGCSKY